MSHVKYDTLPSHMQDAAQDYVERGIDPGRHDFLYELLTNDLVGVFQFADNTNLACLQDWITWLWWEPPSSCWGSVEKVKAWIKRGGLEGTPEE